jgi:hypothetical protein
MIFYRYVLEQWDSTKNFQKKHITEIAGPVSFILMKKGFLKVKFILQFLLYIIRSYKSKDGITIQMDTKLR